MNITQSHSFSVQNAKKYGVECAILINHFQFWIEQNRVMGRNFHDGKTWMYQTHKEISAIYPYWTEDVVYKLIKKLIESGVLIKGNYNKLRLDKTAWYAFKNEKIFTKPSNDGMDHNDLEQDNNKNKPSQYGLSDSVKRRNAFRQTTEAIPDTKPDTKELFVKGNDLDADRALPFLQKKESKRKFPLKKEQLPTFELLKELNFECDDDTLIFLIRTFPVDKIYDAITHLRNEILKGTIFKKSRIAFFRNCLNGKQSLVTNRCLENKKMAEEFAKQNGWNWLKIEDKYVYCQSTRKEIPTFLQPDEFFEHLKIVYELNNIY